MVVAYVGHMGAIKSKYPVIIYPTSFGAGVSSHKINDNTEWMLDHKVFNVILAR